MPGDQYAQREAELNAKLEQFEEVGDTEGVQRVNAKLAKLAEKRTRALDKGDAKAAKKDAKAAKSTKRPKK